MLLILIVALCVRVGLVAATEFRPLFDSFDYHRHALSISSGEGYPPSLVLDEIRGPSAFRPPAYPYALAAAYEATGKRWTAGRLLGAGLGVVTVLLIYLLAAAGWGRRAGLAAGWIAALYPPLVAINGTLFSEALFLPFEVGAVLAAVYARASPDRFRWAIVAGALCGAAALTRFNGFLLLVPVIAGTWVLRPRLSWRSLARPAAAAVAAALVIAPWTIRNAVEFDRFIPVSTEGGRTLAGTFNAKADSPGTRKGSGVRVEETEYGPLLYDRTLNEAELDAELRRRALEYAARHPGYVVETGLLNTARLLHPAGWRWMRIYTYGELGVSDKLAGFIAYSYYAVAGLAIVGALAVAGRFGAQRGPVFVWLAPVVMAASAVVVAGTERLRAPVDPFLVVLAGIAVARLTEVMMSRRRSS